MIRIGLQPCEPLLAQFAVPPEGVFILNVALVDRGLFKTVLTHAGPPMNHRPEYAGRCGGGLPKALRLLPGLPVSYNGVKWNGLRRAKPITSLERCGSPP